MSHSVRDVLSRIPILDAKMRAPAWIEDRFCGDFGPDAIALKLQPGFAFFIRFKRIELRCQLQHAVVMRVEGEGNDLITGHVHGNWLCWILCGWTFGYPPLTRRK